MVFPDLNVAENIFISHRTAAASSTGGACTREAAAILAQLGVRLDVRQPGARPDPRRPADGRDRQGHLAQCPRPDHGRADGLALRARGRAAVQAVALAARAGRRDPVHQPPAGGGLRDRRPGDGLPRRPADLHPALARSPTRCAIRDMVGRELDEFFAKRRHPAGETLLEVDAASAPRGRFRGHQLRPSSAGEVAGLRGPGRRAAHRRGAGAVRHRARGRGRRSCSTGKPVAIRSPQQAHGLGIAYVTEDRRQLGLSMPHVDRGQHHAADPRRYLNRLGLIDRRRERRRPSTSGSASPSGPSRSTKRWHALGRQPAEGHAQQVAERTAQAPDPRRADARHRRGREGRGPPHDQRARSRRASRSS